MYNWQEKPLQYKYNKNKKGCIGLNYRDLYNGVESGCYPSAATINTLTGAIPIYKINHIGNG